MTHNAAECCPDGSWPALKEPKDYELKGKVMDIGDGMEAYVVGDEKNKDEKAILLIPDLFGIDSGRTKQIADTLADQDYFVVCPDLFRGSAMLPKDISTKLIEWASARDYKTYVKPELEKVVFPFIESKGLTKIAAWGFCWGSWCIFKIANDKDLKEKIFCGVNCHPSVKLEQVFKRDPLKLAEEDMKTPMLLLAAENDPAYVRENGAYVQQMKENNVDVAAHNFDDMQHGWVNRGDLSDKKVKRDVENAIEYGLRFLEKQI